VLGKRWGQTEGVGGGGSWLSLGKDAQTIREPFLPHGGDERRKKGKAKEPKIQPSQANVKQKACHIVRSVSLLLDDET